MKWLKIIIPLENLSYLLFLCHQTRLKADRASFSAGIFLGIVTFSIIQESVKLGDILTIGVGFGIGSTTFSIVRYIDKQETKLM
jgi:hypothetical protein